uniref:Ig-like domain-containing protein n=1 Tax=Maylandia zebra TaxID=106582 RepID=A0A3P9DRR4_9CICH
KDKPPAGAFSQHALAVEVEGNTEAESVQLPCQHSGFIPDDNPTVTWTRNDLDPTTVHVRRKEGDDLKGQNRSYSRRTSMRPDALDSLDFSLTLRKPQLTDSGKYSCTLSDGRKERTLTDVQLQVKGQPQTSTPMIPGQRSILFRGLCLFILLYYKVWGCQRQLQTPTQIVLVFKAGSQITSRYCLSVMTRRLRPKVELLVLWKKPALTRTMTRGSRVSITM